MEVSSDGGATWNYNFGTATGDIGASIPIGTNKTITWTYSGGYNNQFMIKIISKRFSWRSDLLCCKIYNTVTIGSQTLIQYK